MNNDKIGYYYITLFLLIISTFFLIKVVKSNFGLSIVALKDYEEYAISRGISYGNQLILSFAASSLFTGAAGAIMAFYLHSLSPEMAGFSLLTTVLTMVIVGGLGTIYGPIIGAFIFTIVSEYLVRIGPWRYVIISSLIIFTITFYPQGVWLIFAKTFKRLNKKYGNT